MLAKEELMQEDNLKFLENLICNNKELQQLEKMFEKFNIFDCLKLSRQEIRHSNFLAWLFDPKETHGLGDYFLKEYLKYVIQSNRNKLNGIKSYKVPTVFDIDCWNMSDIEVRREYKNIDLLLIDETNKFIFLIENKVDSFQHDNQLEKYRQIVDTEYSSNDYKKLFVYLKPKAEEVEKPYIFVNYKSVHETINKLLEMKSDVISDEINMVISHYKQILERDIMNEDEIKEICLKIYKNHKRAIDLINEHIQTTPKGMLAVLDEVISKLGWIKLDSQNSIIRCIPKSLDIQELKFANGYVSTNQVLAFEFMNKKDSLDFDVVIAKIMPENQQKKTKLCECIANNLTCRTKKYDVNYVHIASLRLFNSDDYIEITHKSNEEIVADIIQKIDESNIIPNLEKSVNNFIKEV